MPGARRVGVMGGTFDPPHRGHVAAAREVLERLALDEVILVPAGQPWQKDGHVVASADQRFEMTRAAVEGLPGLSVSDIEVRRDGPTYTVDTLRELRRDRPDTQFLLILGADAATGLHTWHEPEEVVRLARVVALTRPGHPVDEATLPEDALVVPIPAVEVSSSACRDRVARGESLSGLVPDAVSHYVEEHALYRRAASGGASGGPPAGSPPRGSRMLTSSIVGTVSLALVLVASLVVAAVDATARGASSPSPGTAVESADPALTRPVLGVLVRGRDGTVTAAAVIVSGTGAGASRVLVLPPTVLVDSPTQGVVLLSRLAAVLPGASTTATLAAATGLRVDGTLVLDSLAVAGLVDAVGPITVEVAEPLALSPVEGAPPVVLSPGSRRLAGLSAAAYLAAEDGSPQVRAQRVAQVLEQVLVRLPRGEAGMVDLIGSLGLSARSSLSTAGVVLVLQRAALDVRRGLGRPRTAPTLGGGSTVRLDRRAIRDEVQPEDRLP